MLMRLHKIRLGSKGFTLVELMVVVGILGVLGAVAIPMITSTLPNYRLRAAARELVIDFKKAKMEAVKRNRTVILQFTPETVGDPDQGGSYLMCVDENGNDDCDADETIKTISMPHQVRLVGTTFTFPLHMGGYTNRGLPWKNNWGAVTLRTGETSREYEISLTSAGGVRLE